VASLAQSRPSGRTGPTRKAGASDRTPLWAIAVGAALHFIGRTSRRPRPPLRLTPARTADPKGRAGLSNDPSHPSSSKICVADNKDQDDRGRSATGPTEIPVKGWKDIALRIYHGITEDRILAIAAGVTFYILLASFPAIAGLIALYGLYADAATIREHLNLLSGILPEGGISIIRDQVERLTAQPAQRLGLATFIGLGISLWSANGGMKAILDALNVVYHEKEKRGFVRLNAVSLAFTLGAIVFVLMALAAIAILPPALNYLGFSRAIELLAKVGRWPALLLVVSFAIALIYRYGPSRDKPQWRWISPGSAFAAVVWIAASLLFSWYTENFGKYNETYGSLGAAIGFMTWLWLSIIVISVGAKINAEMEHQTARDSTEGEPRPRGERGAEMADTVGRARAE
jgi:membrane protein